MPRIRSLKPEIVEDEKLGAVPIEARWLFVALIAGADDLGNLRGAIGYIRSRAFPYDDVTLAQVDGWLSDLAGPNLIQTYAVHGEKFIHLTGWGKHQKVQNPAKVYPIPGPEHADAEPTEGLHRVSVESHPRARASQLPASSSQLPALGSNEPLSTSAEPKPDDKPTAILDVFTHWQTVLSHPRAKLVPARKAKIRARLREGYTVEDCKAAIDGCAASKYHTGANDEGKRYDGIKLIFRSGEDLERFRGYLDARPKGHRSFPEAPPEPEPENGEVPAWKHKFALEAIRDRGQPWIDERREDDGDGWPAAWGITEDDVTAALGGAER